MATILVTKLVFILSPSSENFYNFVLLSQPDAFDSSSRRARA